MWPTGVLLSLPHMLHPIWPKHEIVEFTHTARSRDGSRFVFKHLGTWCCVEGGRVRKFACDTVTTVNPIT